MNKRYFRWLSSSPFLAFFLLMGGLSWVPGVQAANCTAPSAPTPLPFGTRVISIPASQAVGPIVGSSVSVPITFVCTGVGGPNAATIVGTQLSPYTIGGGGLLFDTNLNGISLLVTASPTPTLMDADNVNLGQISTNNLPLTVTFTGQFYRNTAGPIQLGPVNAIFLANAFNYVSNSSTANFAGLKLTLDQGVTINGSCTVNSPANFAVTLPTISQTALAGPIGTAAGLTSFNLSYACPWAGTTVTPSMTGSNPDATIAGLMNPAAGKAANVGLRLMTGDLTAGVDIKGAKQPSVVSNGSLLSLPYYVEYYRTGTGAIGAGQVTGSVTYTLSYQ